jgi:hypothetical protein
MANPSRLESRPSKNPGNRFCKASGIKPTELQWQKLACSRAQFDSQPRALDALYMAAITPEELTAAQPAIEVDPSSFGPAFGSIKPEKHTTTPSVKGESVDVFNRSFGISYTAGEIDSGLEDRLVHASADSESGRVAEEGLNPTMHMAFMKLATVILDGQARDRKASMDPYTVFREQSERVAGTDAMLAGEELFHDSNNDSLVELREAEVTAEIEAWRT